MRSKGFRLRRSSFFIFATCLSILLIGPTVLAATPYENLVGWWNEYITHTFARGIIILLLMFALFYILLGRVFGSEYGSGIKKREKQVLAVILAAITAYYSQINPVLIAVWEIIFSFGLIPIGIALLFLFLAAMLHRAREAHTSSHIPALQKKAESYDVKTRLLEARENYLTRSEQKESKHVMDDLKDIDNEVTKIEHEVEHKPEKTDVRKSSRKIKSKILEIRDNVHKKAKQIREQLDDLKEIYSSIVHIDKEVLKLRGKSDIAKNYKPEDIDAVYSYLKRQVPYVREEHKNLVLDLKRCKEVDDIVRALYQQVISLENARPQDRERILKDMDKLLKKAEDIEMISSSLESKRRNIENKMMRLERIAKGKIKRVLRR